MVNLSSRTLSQLEIQVLNLGLGFVPAPLYNPFRDHIELFKLIRTLKLKRFFGSEESKEPCPFKRTSTFIPSVNDPSITVFEKLVLKWSPYKQKAVTSHKSIYLEKEPQRLTSKVVLERRGVALAPLFA